MSLISPLEWLDQHPQIYLYGVLVTILGSVFVAIRPVWRSLPDDANKHDWIWGVAIFAILTAGRWPSLFFDRPLNPDEGQLLAGAHALRFDPVFWRSVNGATAGPFDFFALIPAGSLCGADGYLSARLTALILITLCVTLTHQCLALWCGKTPARFATLVTSCFEALTVSADFLHYSTEVMPMALGAGAAYAATRRWAGSGGGWIWSGLGGFLLGAIPLAKVQAAPMALLAGIGWAAYEFHRSKPGERRALAYLLVGAVTPASLFASQLALAGEWDTFIQSFFVYNFTYVSVASQSLGDTLSEVFKGSVDSDSLLHVWLIGVGAWLATLLIRPTSGTRRTNYLTLAAAGLVIVALGCILTPHRPFLHYWQLLVMPLTLLLGFASARFIAAAPELHRNKARGWVAGCAILLVAAMLSQRVAPPYSFVRFMAYTHKTRPPLTFTLLKLARPGDLLAVWGWTNELYVETGLRQATRDAHIGPLFETGRMKEYFQERYLADFLDHRPALFVDTVGIHSLTFNAPEFRHEHSFPALGAAVAADYTLVATVQTSRIYRRNDLIAP